MPQKSYYAMLGIPDFSLYPVCKRAWKRKTGKGIACLTHDELKDYAVAWYMLQDPVRKFHYDYRLQQQLDTIRE